ncbi:hypothetical protein [Poseidonibacter lekithochrous]|uniref:hypothetical protein n=1 Tax=Poseidonibacter lekithochrous TaxID=1904463 RepID=UPI0008FC8BEF|nr:hypothetical protein [Poseidonibacter lekithochrous]QKJ21612.1 hypothetical protein ALEK_0309 [Poseidonibacter lekithochrous]
MKYLLISLTALFLFTGCSNKKYFEPEDVNDELKVEKKDLSDSIKSMNRIGATLEDGTVITQYGVSKFKLPENFDFINLTNEGDVIATNNKDSVLIGKNEILVKNVVVAAALKDEKLALVYSDNSIELIDINTKKTLYKEYLQSSLANDSRITNPYFMGNLILFPTLNGKVIIVSSLNNESVKNIAVDPKGQFNNIIFLDVLKDSQTLITATPNKIVSISTKEILAKEYEIRDVIINGEFVYVATIDGQIIKLTSSLVEVAKKKYQYSKINALAYTDSLYAIESQGYIINIDEEFVRDEIYEFDFNNEDRLIVIDNKIYFDEDYITLP